MLGHSFISLVLLLLCAAPALAHERSSLLSEAELVELYGDASDELSNDEAASLLLMLANEERSRVGLGRLQHSSLAQYMARRHAGDMVRLGYSSHLDTDGRNPVERYNRLGGTDYVQENLILLEMEWPLYQTERLVRSFHREWMDSPGHRAALLSPQATQMGCAFELERNGELNRMAGVCEFVAEHGDYSRLPQRMAAGDKLRFNGQLAAGSEFGWLSIGITEQAQSLEPADLNELPDSYSIPDGSLRLQPGGSEPDSAMEAVPAYLLEVDAARGTFQLELLIPPDWNGQTAYFYIYAQPAADTEMRCVASQTIEIES